MPPPYAIDWTSAAVSPEEAGFELSVRLTGPIDAEWLEAFIAQTQRDTLRSEKQGWRDVTLAGETIVVKGLEADARQEVRGYLDGLVGRINDLAEQAQAEEERQRLLAEERAQEQERRAAELTDWFRSASPSSTPAPAAEEPGRPWGRRAREGEGEG